MRRDDSRRHRYFAAYCENLQRIGLIELIDEHRRQAEQRAWRASLVRGPILIAETAGDALVAAG